MEQINSVYFTLLSYIQRVGQGKNDSETHVLCLEALNLVCCVDFRLPTQIYKFSSIM